MRTLRTRVVLSALTLVLAFTPAAVAQLLPKGTLGPIDTVDGFPVWVGDINGVQLDLPNPPYGDGLNAPTLIYDPAIADNPLSLASGFGAEAFFYLAESVIRQPNGGRSLLLLGIEAAYGAGEPDLNVPADQFLFARVRVRFDAAVAGTYTVTHPWGVENLVLSAADVGARFSHTYDWGGFAPITDPATSSVLVPSSFERILYSPNPWRFLKATTKNVQVAGDEAFIVGDGVTPTTVTGGFNDINSFTIVGPTDAFGPGVNTVTSNLFTVSGHIYGQPIPTTGTIVTPPPTQVDTVIISRARYTTNDQTLEIRASSTEATAILTAVGYGQLTNGKLRIRVSPAPSSVTVTSSFGGVHTEPVQIK